MNSGPKSILKDPSTTKGSKRVFISAEDEVIEFSEHDLRGTPPNRYTRIIEERKKVEHYPVGGPKSVMEEFQYDMCYYGKALLHLFTPLTSLALSSLQTHFEPLPGENLTKEEYKERYTMLL